MKIVRTLTLAGLVGATALLGAPLAAAGVERNPVAAAADQSTAAPRLGDDTRTVPAAQERAEKLGLTPTSESIRTMAALSGTHSIYVSVVDVIPSTTMPANQSFNANLDQASVTNAVAAIDSFWSEQSAGAVRFQLGGYESRSLSATSCDPDAVFDSQQGAAFGGRFDRGAWVGTSEHLLTLTVEKSACRNGAGFGTLGGDGGLIFSASGIDSAVGIPVLFHEYGHNLGLNHANSAVCRSSSIDASSGNYQYVSGAPGTNGVIATSVRCPVEEYGDVLDIMGYTVSNSAPHASSVERYALGWLPAIKPAVAAKTTVVLRPLGDATGSRAVRVTDPRSGAVYFVEYRTPAGRDAASSEFSNTRAGTYYRGATYTGDYTLAFASGDAASGIVRILRPLKLESGAPSASTVLGVTPMSSNGRVRLDSLGVGDSFTTSGGGTKISVSAMGPAAGATISITTKQYASKTAIKPAHSSIKRNTNSRLAITVTSIGTKKPAGKVSVYAKGKALKGYTLSSSKGGRITVTLPKFSKKGSYPLTVKYSGSTLVAGSTSAAKTVTVR